MTWIAGWTWTDDRVEELKALFAQKKTGTQIQMAMGAPTRNVIVGKLARLGLNRGGTRIPGQPRAQRKPKPRQTGTVIRLRKRPTGGLERRAEPVFDTAPLPDMVEPIIPMEQRCSVLDLNDSKCRWPIGDPQVNLFFCGAIPADGLPYCGFHSCVAYRPAPERRRNAAWRGRV
jgi:GcrA cell cycle regulator